MTQNKNNKPVHAIRYGNVRAAIWCNENGFHNVSFERSYRQGDEWKQIASFGRDDLPKLVKAAEGAYLWIFEAASGVHTSETEEPNLA